MSKRSRSPSGWRRTWRWLRVPLYLLAGFSVGFLGPYVWLLDHQLRGRFDQLTWQIPSRVYARSLELTPGLPMDADTLRIELDASRYRYDEQARAPGTFAQAGNRFVISRRDFVYLDGRERARRLQLTLANGRIASLADADSATALSSARLEPAHIATLYGASEQDRRLVSLGRVPPLLVTGLQAVEDRSFKHHRGVDVTAVLRAAWRNLLARRVVQGGSTLSQQLVRNLYLERDQNMARKLNEALISLLIEARYDKREILEAYVNEVFLGQRGGQAVHGFAAASTFYFGRELDTLGPADIALLVGLVRGPSYYDPRSHPQRALQRRNRVLAQFHETGLIDATTHERQAARPLGISMAGALPRNRYPAFVDLVRAQLRRDYADAQLGSAGLSIHTTLAPSTQLQAERALTGTLASLGARGQGVQAAVVVTGSHDGEVHALIGNRDPDAPGFNRAMQAARPIGSLVKPFVYLAALAQPQRYSLASILDDVAVDLPQADGSRWTPKNNDGQTHGQVLLIDALTRSLNLATVHLGMRVGVDRVRGLLQSFRLQRTINPNPSLLLGAVALTPLDVAQLYQYLAGDGHALPLRSVRGVLDDQGRPLARYRARPGVGDYVGAVRLINHALQQAASTGTARSLNAAGLAHLRAAGKTGTSDGQRDAWFAGYTGAHLAVVWLGRDDNKPTTLYGASGALPVWIALMKELPTSPLQAGSDGLEYVWIDSASGQRLRGACAGARELPFISGYAPQESMPCPQDSLGEWLSSGGVNHGN